LQTNKISSSKTSLGVVVALSFGVLLNALPATAETISFTTGPIQTNLGTGSYDVVFLGADVPSFDPSAGSGPGGGTFFNAPGLTGSFGMFGFNNGSPTNGNVVSVDVTPSINGAPASPSIDFSGTIAVNSGAASVTFGGPTESINGNQYVYQVSNGVQYAIEQTQSLPTSASKTSFLVGFVGVASAVTPEPATLATTGLALLLAGFVARRRAKATS
jgi:hypothetical protein